MKNEEDKIRDARIQELLNESDSDDEIGEAKKDIIPGRTPYIQQLRSDLYKKKDANENIDLPNQVIKSSKEIDDLLNEDDSSDDEITKLISPIIPIPEKEHKIASSDVHFEALEENKIAKEEIKKEIKEEDEEEEEEEEGEEKKEEDKKEIEKEENQDDFAKLSQIEIIDIIENKFRVQPKKVDVITIANELKKHKGTKHNTNRFTYESNLSLQTNFYKNMNTSKCTPSSILCRNGTIFIGSKEGIIRIFSDNNEYLEISNPIIHSDVDRQSVTCLDFDIIGKRHFLISGYENGSIMVFNLKEGKCI